MRYRVIFTPQAQEQLADLYNYIAEAASPNTAARYTDAIVSYCEFIGWAECSDAQQCGRPNVFPAFVTHPSVGHRLRLSPTYRAFVEASPVALRPLAYINFIIHWVQEDDFHGCAFINATAEYAQTDAPAHQQAAAHKKEICGYLTDLCAAAGVKQPAAVAMPLYLIGEGLIVACQVQGHNASLLEAARASACTLWASFNHLAVGTGGQNSIGADR